MFQKILKIITLGFVVISLFSCKSDEEVIPVEDDFSNIYNLPSQPYNYSNVDFPITFTSELFNVLDNTPDNNHITNDGATLGRVLFYDKNLSINNTIACASCHRQEFGFSDQREKSVGFAGGETRRNSMSLANARFYLREKFFWDHRANTLEEQVLEPFQDPVEMGMTLELVESRVSSFDYYKPLFRNAFNSEEVTGDKISKALSQFIRSIYSYNTKYDEGIEATRNIFVDFPNFTAQENLGKDIFNGKLTPTANGSCLFCHMNDKVEEVHFSIIPSLEANQVIFTGTRTDNIGLDENSHVSEDNGLGEVTDIDADNGQFKVPSIRNIELTSPYMHDGRFQTLEEVVEHYSTGVKDHPELSDHLIEPDESPRNLNLTEEEKAALVAFLKTLTDDVMINDEKYANPFVE